MSTIAKKSAPQPAAKKTKSKSELHIPFNPNLNGTYRIRFPREYSGAGFKVLIKGGMFHRFPDGFVVTKRHTDLLKKAKVPYEIIKS